MHVYENASSKPYTVTLIATGPGGRVELRKDTIITVYDLPRVNFAANPSNVFLPDAECRFTNLSYDGVKTTWKIINSDLEQIWTDTNYNSSYVFQKGGKYGVILIVETEHGCKDSLLRPELITVDNGGKVLVPNVFTPNGDNSNEVFIPVTVGVRKEDYHFRIYDRWGKRVFETDKPGEGWDGKVSGEPAVTETYVWIVEGTFVTDERFVKKGTVTLLR